jgi:predicted RNA methylase
MARLSKEQLKKHEQACELLKKDVLTYEDKLFVLENWQESFAHANALNGAFFTPLELAREFAIETTNISGTIVDLCAGIGALSFAVLEQNSLHPPKITCVEIVPEYAEVGKKICPEADWIVADVLDLPPDFGKFEFAIANPPFGRIRHAKKRPPRYRGSEFEYVVIDIASDLANDGIFLLPQSSVPFNLSKVQSFSNVKCDKYEAFREQTAIELGANCGIDTTACQPKWHGVDIVTEISCVDFREARARRNAVVEALVESAEDSIEATLDIVGVAPRTLSGEVAVIPDSVLSSAAPVQQSLFPL